MLLYPRKKLVDSLSKLYDDVSNIKFPPLRNQFDEDFEQRYEEFWEKHRGNMQPRLFSVLDKNIKPSDVRLNFDLDVCKAIGIKTSKKELMSLYKVFVDEMIIIRGLIRD